MGFLNILLIFGTIYSMSACLNVDADSNYFNVVDYGAVGNGQTDDSQAFSKAWKDTCSAKTGIPTMIVPKGKKFLVNPITFDGPCNAKNVGVQIDGDIMAPEKPSTWKGLDQSQWLAFGGVNGLTVSGLGTIDGQGSGWWNQSCRFHPGPGCTGLAPTMLKFLGCKETYLNNVIFINSPQTHVLIMGCEDVHIDGVRINTPEAGPNTDGIHIQSSQHVHIDKSYVGSGDDCISIGDLTSDIRINGISCGPGHGISIGSLGKGPDGGTAAQVENINVSNVHFVGTTNGVRIKTYQVGTGYARGIKFEHLNFTNVQNPIIIDQNYCEKPGECPELATGVNISDVSYFDAYGTSSTEVAVNFNCSKAVPCTGITLSSIRLTSAKPGQKLISSCNNAKGNATGVIKPASCLD